MLRPESLKQRGRAMNLVDMKLEKKAREKMAALPSPSIDEYPWGCRITLDGDAMKKLGLKPADFKAGQRVKVEAVGKVVEIASRQTEGSNTDGNRMGDAD